MPAPVVVVHDDPIIRETAIQALQAAGFEAVAFDDPMRALAAVEKDSSARVLVSRINFGPGKLNGPALWRMLKFKRSPGLPITALYVDAQKNAPHVDNDEFLPLPLDAVRLVGAVQRLLAG